jgi:hypothetical protein
MMGQPQWPHLGADFWIAHSKLSNISVWSPIVT